MSSGRAQQHCVLENVRFCNHQIKQVAGLPCSIRHPICALNLVMRLRYYWVRRQSSQSRHFVIHPCFVSMAWQSFQHHDCPTHQILRLLPTIDFDLPHQQVQLLCLFWLDQSYQNHLRSHFSLFAQLCAKSSNHSELLASYLICCFLSATQLLKRNPLWSNLDLSERKVMKD